MVGWGSFPFDRSAVIIILDSVGYNVFKQADTPNIEALRGTEFPRCFSQASQTLAAYYLMMIGHFPYQDGREQIFGRGLWLPLDFKTKNRRYQTVAVVSMPYLDRVWGCDKGWDVFLRMPRHNQSTLLIKKALQLIEGVELYLLFLNIGDTHIPYEFGFQKTEWRHEEIFNYRYRGGELDPEYLAYLKRRQILAIEYVDAQLGKLFREIDLPNVTVMVTSDHGELFGEGHIQGHGIGHHPTLFHVPMIIKK